MSKQAYQQNPWQSSCEVTGLIAGSPAWKAARCQAITGSDLVVLSGLSSTITPLGLYERKLGLASDDEQSKQMEYGLHLEPLLIKWVQQEYPAHKIEPLTLHLASNYNPLHQCTTDAVFYVDGKHPVPLELKTAINTDSLDWEGDGIPEKYNIQIQWQLYITGAPGAYICCLPAGNTYRLIIKPVMANLALQKKLVKLADRFLINLQKKIAPAALEADMQSLAYPKEGDYNPDEDFLKLTAKLIESDDKDIKAQLAQKMGVASTASFELGGKQVTITRKVIKVKEKLTPAYDYQKLTVRVN